jgi:F-type H+-transporting ATPase subunit b
MQTCRRFEAAGLSTVGLGTRLQALLQLSSIVGTSAAGCRKTGPAAGGLDEKGPHAAAPRDTHGRGPRAMNLDGSRKALAVGLATGWIALAAPAFASEGALEIIPDLRLLALLVVLFMLLVRVLNRLLFQPLLGVLDERDQKIEGTRTRAAELNQEAEAELARHEAAVRAARAEAERGRKAALEAARTRHAESVSAARSESARVVESARAQLRAALGEARRVLQTQTRELAREAAARVLGRSLS